MWYFSWALGVLLTCSLVIINLLRLESLNILDKENVAMDSLSQLLTKESVLNMLRRKVAYSKQSKTPFSLLYLSLKDAKNRYRLTDHEMDEILFKIASSLKKDIRVKKDTAARVGREEFLLIIFGASKRNAENVVSRLKDNILATIKTPMGINLAVGIVEYSPDIDLFSTETDEAEGLLDNVISKCFKA